MTPDSASDAQSTVTAATTGVTVIDHCAEVSSPPGGGGVSGAGAPDGGRVGVAVVTFVPLPIP
ncbi:hypothetical protein JCM33774_65080 [Actinophytocola sp. KF-1]